METLSLATLLASGLYHMLLGRRNWKWIGYHAVASILLYSLPPHSLVASFWSPLTVLASQWHRLAILSQWKDGGPLGPGYQKVVEVLVGCGLFRISYHQWPRLDYLPTERPPLWLLGTVLFLSVTVPGVLWLWSRSTQSRGRHAGVQRTVATTLGRSLTTREHAWLLWLALLNAWAEESTSRGLWRLEYARVLSEPWQSNVCQAIVFGIWHYNGIPSGFTGIGLTFVYGGIMGMLADVGGGLFLPIVTHTIADYFIFAMIARRKDAKNE